MQVNLDTELKSKPWLPIGITYSDSFLTPEKIASNIWILIAEDEI